MIYITYNFLWAFSFLFLLFYLTLVFSVILYALPQICAQNISTRFKKAQQTKFIDGSNLHFFLLTFVFLVAFINYTWISPSVTSWFGHLVFTSFQRKFVFFSVFIFYLCTLFFSSTFIFGSYEVNDYLITCINFYLWTLFLFTANTLFAVVFFIEVISTLILLLVATSTFSTSYFYSNVSFDSGSYHTRLLAPTYFSGLLFFFWVSLLASVNLFLFLIFFYTQFFTLEWNISEFVLSFTLCTSSFKQIFAIFFVWLFFFFCVFLKCGLVPFYFWKPVFFKGLPFHALFFYVFFYYFFIFLFFIALFFFYLNELFYIFALVFNLFLILGFTSLFIILCEAYYLKVFLAMSSILNTLFVFLVFSNLAPDFSLFVI